MPFGACILKLLKTMPGEFAAIYQGQLVDHDVDQMVLFQRIEAAYPGQPVLIRQVRPRGRADHYRTVTKDCGTIPMTV